LIFVFEIKVKKIIGMMNKMAEDYNFIKKGIVAGAIAGLAGGISAIIFGGIGATLGLYGLRVLTVEEWSIYTIILTLVYGIIIGVIYGKMHDSMPGKGIWKGTTAGLLVWLIKDVTSGIDLAIEQEPISVIAMIWVGFFTWIVYGLVIGKLYRK
jgi:hypothetical protein